MLTTQMNIAGCLERLGRDEEALDILRHIHERRVALNGISHEDTVLAAGNVGFAMVAAGRCAQAKRFLREQEPIARRALGPTHVITHLFAQNLSAALQEDPMATRADLTEAEAILQDLVQTRRRLLGAAHPHTHLSEASLARVRERLAREFGRL